MSKVFDRAIFTQLMNHFNNIFNPLLSAFRPGYGCNTTLLKIIEDWKASLDKNHYVAAILMDLSKAFDCLPHNLLVLKLKHYGLDNKSVSLIDSYLSQRKQCVKVGDAHSSFQETLKGVPQGSILGPVLFNIFINDIFEFMTESNLYNYADDNTLSYSSTSHENLVKVLENDSLSLIKWFHENKMQANPEKFQAMSLGKKTHDLNISFKFNDVNIKCEDEVVLLGVTLDFNLNFNSHISSMCRKASRQLNVMKRIGHNLNKLCKITMYQSFILSNFNYCPLTWHFTNETNTKKMEKIQERALRFIYDDFTSDYNTLLTMSGFPSLRIRRLRIIAQEFFKMYNKDGPTYLHDLVEIKEHSYNFRYSNTAKLSKPRTTRYGINSFRYTAAKIWNTLPNHFRQISSFNTFKSMLGYWNGSVCSCPSCVSH